MWEGFAKFKTLKIKALNIFPKIKLLLTCFFQKANKESLTMTVKRLLPVIALFSFNYIFGNEIQRHTHHDNLSNHSKIQK